MTLSSLQPIQKLDISNLETLFPNRHWAYWLPKSLSDGVVLSLLVDFRNSEDAFVNNGDINAKQPASVANVTWFLRRSIESLQDDLYEKAKVSEGELRQAFATYQYLLEREAIGRITGISGNDNTAEFLVRNWAG